MDVYEKSLQLHEQWAGKLSTEPKCPVKSREDLSLAYTPGVAEPCRRIADNPADVYKYTQKGNTVAVVSDGSAVLGLGNIGAAAAMPVMEGKAVLFKSFGDVNAVPICLDTQDTDEIVETVIRIAPAFGGINLEDISAPRCFEIEQRLNDALDIPVFHDDQHGTAICCAAAMINACRLTGRKLSEIKMVVNGAGAAAIAVTKLLVSMGLKNVIMCDKFGALYEGCEQMNAEQAYMATITNPENKRGTLADVLPGADIFFGMSAPNVLTKDMVRTMAKDPMVFPMANPTPEIMPEDALEAGAAVVGCGRSDYPNQINNVLAFPGVFRGALDVRASDINEEMKIAAAYAIANVVSDEELNAQYIMPKAFDPRVRDAVAAAVAQAARDSGVARI